jgi:hypothetical protein
MTKALICALAITALTTPALADYWVVQDSSTKHCEVVNQKPTTTTKTVLGDTVFKTHEEARNSMKTMSVCSSK